METVNYKIFLENTVLCNSLGSSANFRAEHRDYKLTPVVFKSVKNFVSDGGTDCTEVDGPVKMTYQKQVGMSQCTYLLMMEKFVV